MKIEAIIRGLKMADCNMVSTSEDCISIRHEALQAAVRVLERIQKAKDHPVKIKVVGYELSKL